MDRFHSRCRLEEADEQIEPMLTAIVTAAWLAYAVASAILSLPFGMAEPGQPHGLGGLGLFWAFGESCRTWWVFVRRSARDTPLHDRWEAFLIVFIPSAIACVWGFKLAHRGRYEASEIVAAVTTTAACWLGRYRLRARQAKNFSDTKDK